jgi:hypothetical protein
MGTNMMPPQSQPGAPQAPDSPAEAGGYPAAFSKAADSATQALSQMFKICHQQEPDSPLCDALQNMIKAVAEIETRAGMGSGTDGPAEELAEGEGPMDVMGGEQPPSEGPPQDVPMSGNPAFAQAANEAVNMMQAKKRPPGA